MTQKPDTARRYAGRIDILAAVIAAVAFALLAYVRPVAAGSQIAFIIHEALFAGLIAWAGVRDARKGSVLTVPVLVGAAIILPLSMAAGFDMKGVNAGVLLLAAFFGLQYMLSNGRWAGKGDIWLGALAGAGLGWPLALAALAFAYVAGALVVLPGLIRGKKGLWSRMPMGAALAFAALVAAAFRQEIGSWLISHML